MQRIHPEIVKNAKNSPVKGKNEKNSPLKAENCKEFTTKRGKLQRN